jgi:hypothetical protein
VTIHKMDLISWIDFINCGISKTEFVNLQTAITNRQLCGAEEACWAHNPKVRGSKPRGATVLLFLFLSLQLKIFHDWHWMEILLTRTIPLRSGDGLNSGTYDHDEDGEELHDHQDLSQRRLRLTKPKGTSCVRGDRVFQYIFQYYKKRILV